MRNWIISANWRDGRRATNKWLVRRSDQSPQEAVACSTVHAKGVIFCPATEYETGFGCSIVGFANEVLPESGSIPEGSTPIKFNFNKFINGDGQEVPEVNELFLSADWSMYAVV